MRNMWRGAATGVLCAAYLLPAATGATGDSVRRRAHRDGEVLTLEQARAYMVELINRDRATKNLTPVQLDPVATAAGQKHAEEMAAHRFLAHWNLQGKLPDQRYTEQGGMDYDRENVYLLTRSYGPADEQDDGEALPVIAAPTFTRQEIEEIEASYFNETPPTDGHRRNILTPQHTHVGIALARAGSQDIRTMANTQEFVDHYVEVKPIPVTCAVGSWITVSGRTLGHVTFRAVSVARAKLPAPMSRADLNRSRTYSVPSAYVTFFPEPYESPIPVAVTSDGHFSVRFPLSAQNETGLYYVCVWVQEDGRDIVASQRTVVVR